MKRKVLIAVASVLALLFIIFLIAPEPVQAIVNWNFTTIKVKTNFWTGSYVAGSDTFTTGALRDTIAFTAGVVKSTDVFIVSMMNDSVPIGWMAKTDSLIVLRKSGGTAGPTKYTYLRLVPK